MALATATVVYHRRRAAAGGGEPSARSAEGRVFLLALRAAGAGLWAATSVYLVAPERLAWASWGGSATVRWSGAIVGVVGLALLHATLRSLGRNLTDTASTRAEATLVVDGPYRRMRHPYYTAAALLIAGTTLLSADGLIAATGALVLILLAARTPLEERMLVERFGEAYRAYQARTKRFWPW